MTVTAILAGCGPLTSTPKKAIAVPSGGKVVLTAAERAGQELQPGTPSSVALAAFETPIEEPQLLKPLEQWTEQEAAADALGAKPFNADFSRNLATVTEAWAKGRSLRLSYRSAGRQRPREVVVDPYFLEPSAAGFATYLIGYSRTHEQMRTFKVERVVSAEMLPQHFQLPDGLEVDRLLSSAWGIIWGEGTQVRLRFSKEVAWRVKESRWHPSQFGKILGIEVRSQSTLRLTTCGPPSQSR